MSTPEERLEQKRQAQRAAEEQRRGNVPAPDDSERTSNDSLSVAAENPGEPARPYVPGDDGYPTETEHGKPGTGKRQARQISDAALKERAK